MDKIFDAQFGAGGVMPLHEPLVHDVEYFYSEAKKSNAHSAMGLLIARLAETSVDKVGMLPITTLRRGQAFLLNFINYDPAVVTGPSLTIELADVISSLNGQEAWQSVALREPNFNEFERYYEKQEAKGEREAMLSLIAEISGVNLFALKKLPYRKYKEAEKYLEGFLFFFPKKDDGKK